MAVVKLQVTDVVRQMVVLCEKRMEEATASKLAMEVYAESTPSNQPLM